MALEALSASMKTRSKGSSELSFVNESAARPMTMVTFLSTPAAFKFSRATFTIVNVMEIISASKVCCIPLRCVGIVQGQLIYRQPAGLVQTKWRSI